MADVLEEVRPAAAGGEAETLRPYARVRFAVYALVDPRDGEARYIGITSSPSDRYRAHCSKATQTGARRRAWLRELFLLGLAPRMRILARVTGAASALEAEGRFVADALQAGARLTNRKRGACAIGGYSAKELGLTSGAP